MGTVMNKKVLSFEGKVKLIRKIENGKKKADLCREFYLRKLCESNDIKKKNGTKTISAFEQNGSRVKA